MGRTARAVGRRDKNGTDGAVEYAAAMAAVALGAADDSAAAKKKEQAPDELHGVDVPAGRAGCGGPRRGVAKDSVAVAKKNHGADAPAGHAGEGAIEENTRGHSGLFDLNPTVKMRG
jgi:hypothetical protein